MKRDIRLYYYLNGSLAKPFNGSKKYHKFTNVEMCKERIKFMKDSVNLFKNIQFVIIEYTDKYHSKILEII